jgi:hypothetical protein
MIVKPRQLGRPCPLRAVATWKKKTRKERLKKIPEGNRR